VIIAIVLILAVSAGLRLWRLDFPAEFMFDEVYYAKDAKAIVEGRVGTDGPLRWAAGDAVSWPHPEIGKLSIAAGIALFGDRAIGWRLPAALAGMVILACIYPLARRCGLSPPWAIVALLFAAADPLGITQSRIATLDIFVATWTVVCLLLALRYVQDGRQLRWLLLSGVAGGLALATKWSGVLALVAAGLLVFGAWLCEWRRGRALERGAAAAAAAEAPPNDETPLVLAEVAEPTSAAAPPENAAAPVAGRSSSLGRRLLGALVAALPVVVAFVLVPALVYAASYTQYFAKGHTLADWWELHRQMYTFGINLHAKHSYASIAPSWIIDYRPVWYYFKGTTELRGVVAIGNPFLWWTATLALVVAPVAALLRHKTALLLPAAFVAVLYLPWFATTRTSFLYYMTPVAPFLAILVAVALSQFAGRSDLPLRRWLVMGAVAIATALLWSPVSRLIEWLFWQLPQRISPTLGWVAIGAGAVLAALGVIALFSRRLRRRRPLIAVVAAGLIVGIVVAFLPVVLAIPISQEYFSRITWFPSWI
jgi:dolichyl-phosphate-mannose--protein O-mannosyl transferase